MSKEELMQNVTSAVTSAFYKAKFKVQQHGPEILVLAGVTGAVVSTVLACRATLKVNDILDESKEDIDAIHNEPEEADKKKELTIAYAKTGAKLVRLYAPSATVGVVSIMSIFAANDILRKRNLAIAAAYTTVDTAFKEYRSRVVDRFGDDVDYELRYNIQREKVEDVVEDEETGKKKKVKNEIEVADPNLSGYARYFDKESSSCWEKAPGYNLAFLSMEESYLNDRLRIQGYLFLNDVYDALGFPRTKIGQAVGWLYRPDDKSISNYVSFGLRKVNRKTLQDFDDGLEEAILLDFNPDGNILNRFCD